MGSAIAHKFKERVGRQALSVSVVEKDPSVSED